MCVTHNRCTKKEKLTSWKKKSKQKVEYGWSEHVMRAILKSVIKCVQNNESGINGKAHHTML